MNQTITLNEAQMDLLREFAEADQVYQEARSALNKVEVTDACFDRLCKDQGNAYGARLHAGAIFASSVLPDYREVSNG
jgi:hypothetical protein